MSLESDATAVAKLAERLLQLANASLGEEYCYQSLPLCVIDAVFSIGVRYSGTRRVVARYCEYTMTAEHFSCTMVNVRRGQVHHFSEGSKS